MDVSEKHGPDAGGGDGDETIDPEPSDDQVRDALPADLDVTGLVGPYVFPNNNRRRIPGLLYLVFAAAAVVVYVVGHDDSPLINGGFVGAAIALALFGLYSLQAGWTLEIDETDALVAATQTAGTPVGHASAQLAWRGLRSRPTWRILWYSNEEPPSRRGLVLVDGVDGSVVAHFSESNPENWASDG